MGSQMTNIINLIKIPSLGDERGGLISVESGAQIPFDIKRVYTIFNTKKGQPRGFHAHKSLRQVLICITGKCQILLDNGRQRETVILDEATHGLLLENFIWREISECTDDCVLLVIASDIYCEEDYIRDYEIFKDLVGQS